MLRECAKTMYFFLCKSEMFKRQPNLPTTPSPQRDQDWGQEICFLVPLAGPATSPARLPVSSGGLCYQLYRSVNWVGLAGFAQITCLRAVTKSYRKWGHHPCATCFFILYSWIKTCFTHHLPIISQILSFSSNRFRGTKSKLAVVVYEIVAVWQQAYFTTSCDPL